MLLPLWLSIGWFAAPPADAIPRGAELAARLHAQGAVDSHARGRLSHGAVFPIAVTRKRLEGVLLTTWSVTGPPGSQCKLEVEHRLGADPVARLDGAALPAARWAENVAGSFLAYADIVEDQFTWPSQTVVRAEDYGARHCWVLHSEPGGRPSAYASVTSWVDRETLVPVRVLKQPRGGAPPKEFLARGLRQSGGHWFASSVDIRWTGRAGVTRLVLTSGARSAAR